MRIEDVDKNFKVETKIKKSDIRFYNAEAEPFKIYGVFKENGKFRRMPEETARAVSDKVYFFHANTAGGRVRFKTSSPYLAIVVKMEKIGKMSHFALTGSAGFDMYVNGVYYRSFVPPFNIADGYEGIVELDGEKMREITLNFPLYSEVCSLYIGLSESAEILPPTPYKTENPVVYYGSSITQGGCASRPGNTYQEFVHREIDADYINLGFSGSALAEDAMADYIKDLKMSAFVYDYDYNAPNADHLAATHEKMFLAVREANPTLPIVIMTRPKRTLTESEKMHFDITKKTYCDAIQRGDKNVYFIDGEALMSLAGEDGTVDGIHPTDFGFYSMASAIIPVLKKALNIR